MAQRANGRRSVTVLCGQHQGGCDDLYQLDQQGQLDSLLANRKLDSLSILPPSSV